MEQRARNNFIKIELLKLGLTSKTWKQLEEGPRNHQRWMLEEAFRDGFFQFSRDGMWMQEAVGESEAWIKLDGMASWHVKWALMAHDGMSFYSISVSSAESKS